MRFLVSLWWLLCALGTLGACSLTPEQGIVNRATIASLNSQGRGIEFYGRTRFSDISREDFAARYLKLKVPEKSVHILQGVPQQKSFQGRSRLPTAVDWRNAIRPVMGPVGDQGECGSCWAFASLTCAEALLAMHDEEARFVDMSEQQLVDCAGVYGAAGCDGGWFTDAFDFMKANMMAEESDYPYTATDRSQCLTSEFGTLSTITSYYVLPRRDEAAMMDRVARGPLAIAVDATKFQFYVSGIMTPSGCSNRIGDVNHAVVIVGYDTTGTTPYWIVRNSWGTGWGESGYLRMEMNRNTCGLANYAYGVE